MLGAVPFMVGLMMFFVRFYKKYSKEYQDLTAKSTQIASEALSNMRVVRSFSTE